MSGKLFSNWRKIVMIFIIAGIILLALSGFLTAFLSNILDPIIQLQTWFSERVQIVYEFYNPERCGQFAAGKSGTAKTISLLRQK